MARNLEKNKVEAQLIAAAASAKGGELLPLRLFDNTTCSTLISEDGFHPGHEAVVNVPTLSMNQILDSVAWTYVDLLKIDIEGAEDELLSVDNQWLAKIGVLMLEIHPNTTPEKIAKIERLIERGVIDQNINVQEMRRVLEATKDGRISFNKMMNTPIMRKLTDIYQGADNFWKIYTEL